MTDIKTLKRNKLGVENLQACLLAKQEFQGRDILLTDDLFERYHQSKTQAEIMSSKVASTMPIEDSDITTRPSPKDEKDAMKKRTEDCSDDLLNFENEEAILQAAERIRFRNYFEEYTKNVETNHSQVRTNSLKRESSDATSGTLKKTKITQQGPVGYPSISEKMEEEMPTEDDKQFL